MQWQELRSQYPNTWVLFEALEAHSVEGKRIVDRISLLNTYNEGEEALKAYRQYHKTHPDRELYVAHTKREALEILERKWLGIRL